MMIARDQNEEDPKEKIRGKKNRGREILPGTAPRDRRRAVRTPFPRARECVSSSRPVSNPFFFRTRATSHHRTRDIIIIIVRRKRVQMRSYK